MSPEEKRAAYFDIHAAAAEAGIPVDSHRSDLYLKDCPEARALLRDYPFKHAQLFRSNIDGAYWWDIPFAFTPYWDAKRAGAGA